MWCKVTATTVYLKNFIPTVCHPDTTSYEDWTGLCPDISHLWPFGCTAYAKIPAEVGGGKLDVRSVKCVLISYFGRGSYHLLNWLTGRTYCSCDVIFEKGLGHRTLPPAASSMNEGESPDWVIFEPSADDIPAEARSPLTDSILITEANSCTATSQPLCRSTRNTQPTNAIFQSQASEAEVTCT